MRVTGLVLAGLIAFAHAALAQEPPRQITVTGEGRVEAAPDMATIRLGVTTEAKGAREAIDTNSKAMAGVLERLMGLGIEDRDLQTSNFSVQPRWSNYRSSNNEQPKIDGFIARNTLTVRVRDLPNLGETLDAVARDGANSFDGLQFGIQEPGPVNDEARRRAVVDARRKAELYAEAAGVTLGDLVRLDEQGGRGQPQMMAMAESRMASDSVPVAAGELTISATVSMVYKIGK